MFYLLFNNGITEFIFDRNAIFPLIARKKSSKYLARLFVQGAAI